MYSDKEGNKNKICFLFSIIHCVFDMYDSKATRQLSLDEVH